MVKLSQVVLLSILACLPFAAGSTSIDLPGAFFKSGHPIKGESLIESVDNPNAIEMLDLTIERLSKYPAITFEIVGHTDSSECAGQECKELSLRRAQLVYRYLLVKGISADRLAALYGLCSEHPIFPDSNAMNRRAEVNYAD